MKANNVNTFLGHAALWLVLASSSLGAPCGSSTHSGDIRELLIYLEDMEALVCNASYFSTTVKEDRSKDCFLYELENIEKTCSTNTEDHSVSAVVYNVRNQVEKLFQTCNFSIGSCEGYEQKNVTEYIKEFTRWVQWKNAMQLMQS